MINTMLDTVRFRFYVTINQQNLDKWQSKGDYGRTYGYTYDIDGYHFHANYCKIPYGENQPNFLDLSFSLPKTLGCNHEMLYQQNLEMALDIIEKIIEEKCGFLQLENLRDAEVSGFHVCYNFNVGTDIDYYLEAIKKIEIPRWKKTIHSSTVRFETDEVTINIYNKYIKCGHPEAQGILRLEVQIKKARRVKEILRIERPTIIHITPVIAKEIIVYALDKTGLNNRLICSETEAEAIIRSSSPSNTVANNLIAYMNAKKKDPVSILKLHRSPPTMRKYENLLREMGITSVFTDEPRTLLPLAI
jgi:hypothetical protein